MRNFNPTLLHEHFSLYAQSFPTRNHGAVIFCVAEILRRTWNKIPSANDKVSAG